MLFSASFHPKTALLKLAEKAQLKEKMVSLSTIRLV